MAPILMATGEAVTVSLDELRESTVSFEVLEEAFGPSSLGVLIVRDLPSQYLDLRRKLLSNASFLANLPLHILGTSPCRYLLSPKISYNFREAYLEITVDLLVSVLDSLSLPEAKFLTGWSHGKEALKDGSYDTYKGSFYVNCGEFGHASVNSQNSDVAYSAYPEVTASNVWPPEEMLPGFRQCFEELCNLIIDIAASVARACDRYALAKIPGYESGYLEKVIRTSSTTKARLLHYFPPHADDHVKQSVLEGEPRESSEELLDSWCATHIDHGCLTGLTSAVYIDESSHEPRLSSSQGSPLPLPHLPFLPNAPDPRSGLYIRSRLGDITRILIPSDCLAFQTGESLQLITGGKFRAVPHFVQAGKALGDTARVARNTLAVFTQPGLDEVVDRETGKTFAQFSMEVAERFG